MKHSTSLFSRATSAGCILILCMSLCRPSGFAQTAFQEFISFPLGDTLASFNFEPTPNGGFGSFGSWFSDQYLFRTDDTGLPTWAGTVHFDTPLLPTFGTQYSAMPDGGALIEGRDYEVYGQGSWERPATCAARIDLDGQVVWSKRYVMADSSQMPGNVGFRLRSCPDGTAIAVGLRESNSPHVLFVMKIDQQGFPIWTTTIDVGSLLSSLPGYDVELMPDGGCSVLVSGLVFQSAIHILRVDGSGDLAWASSYEMTNASWSLYSLGMRSDALGNLVVGSQRNSGTLNYGDLLWLSPTGIPYRHRLNPDGFYSDNLHAWDEGAIWVGRHAIDSTGASVLGGFSIINPGTFSNTDHYFDLRNQHLLNGNLWLSGLYYVVDNTFGYQTLRPFLMRTPAVPITGCRLSPLPAAPIAYINVPDSLLEVTTLNLPWSHTLTSVADTAVVVQNRNPNSVYDLCAIVGVQEEVLPAVTANVWPDPLAQGATLNVDATQPTDLVIHDPIGRIALELLDQRSTRQVSTSAFAPGTYIATGHDRNRVRLWSRPFVVR